MRHLKNYKIFEYASVSIDDWFDVRDVIQMDILDKYLLSTSDLVDPNEDKKYVVDDPILYINYDNSEMSSYVIDDIYALNSRIYEMTGHFIIATNNVNSSKKNIEIKLSKVPDTRITLHHFNLEEISNFDNVINVISKSVGGLCDYKTAIKILEWLNNFYKFCYRTELDAFKIAYDTLSESYNVDSLIFSMPRFEDKNYSQTVCFNFQLKDGIKKVVSGNDPIFVINTSRTYSPYIIKRTGYSSWHESSYDNKERYINFLKIYAF